MTRANPFVVPGLAGLLLGVLTFSPLTADTTPIAAPPVATSSTESKLPKVFDKPAPEGVADLKAMQSQVSKVLKKVMPATVGILLEMKMGKRVGVSAGSGVIINEDGYVLTAGHVSGEPGKQCWVILPDGSRVRAETLGRDEGIDSGMVRILEKRKWPHVPMGDSKSLKQGNWVVAVGHPGGFNPGRTPPVRLGRVLFNGRRLIQTDCTLVGGDSGGPLFDLEGKVIGIHSRIGDDLKANIHVPVNVYRETWTDLAKGKELESSGGGLDRFFARRGGAYLGVVFSTEAGGLRVTEVIEGQPAEKSGLKVGDILRKIDGTKLSEREDLQQFLAKKKPGDEIKLEVERDGASVEIKLKLGRRPKQ